MEHRPEGFCSGTTSAQPSARLHGPVAKGRHGTNGEGETGRLGRLPGRRPLPVQDVHQPHDQVQPLFAHVQQET